MDMETALHQGVAERTRPVVMTALMAAIGLVPAAVSTGIGSETQKPLAIVVIGGLISATGNVTAVGKGSFGSIDISGLANFTGSVSVAGTADIIVFSRL